MIGIRVTQVKGLKILPNYKEIIFYMSLVVNETASSVFAFLLL